MDVLQREISIITNEKHIKLLKECLERRHMELLEIKFEQGKIYMIIERGTHKLAYIGSTIQELYQRVSGHKYFLRENPKSKYAQYIAEAGGIDMFDIVLIEDFPCRNEKELVDREMFFIRALNPPCNTRITPYEINAISIGPQIKKQPICLKCGYIAASPANLKKHMNKKYPCNEGKFRCQFCRFRTSNQNSFYNHRKNCNLIDENARPPEFTHALGANPLLASSNDGPEAFSDTYSESGSESESA